MKTSLAIVMVLLAALVSVGALPVPDSSSKSEHQRRRGFCVVPIPGGIPGTKNKATVYSHQNAIDWIVRPIIEDGFLTAEGTVKGNKVLANNPPGGYATFAVKRRNTDISIAAIVEPRRAGYSYTSVGNPIFATQWNVTDKTFRIKVPAGKINVPADLLVWGAGTGRLSSPLAIHSIEVIE